MATLIPKYYEGETGAVNRPFNLKLQESVSVADFIPVGTVTATTDCSAYFQAAIDTGKAVYVPEGVYQLNSALVGLPAGLGSISNTIIYGENYTTTVLKKIGGGNILEVGDYGRIDISGLLFIGEDATAIKLASGYSTYIYRPVVKNCAFGGNLYRGVDGNYIFATFENCSFGYDVRPYQSVTTVANQTWLYGRSGGGNYENMNLVTQCSFGNCTGTAVDIEGGGQWEMTMCDFEVNYRDIVTNDIQQLVMNSYYSEQGGHPTSQTLFNSTDSGLIIINNANISNNSGGVGASQIGAGGTIRVQINSSRIVTNTGQYVFYNNNDGNHSNPVPPVYLSMLDNKITGNTSDPLYAWGATQTQDVVVKNWAVFNGSTGIVTRAPVGISTLTKNGTGDYSLIFDVRLASSNAFICCVVSGSATYGTAQATGATPNTIRVKTYALGTSTPTDDPIISLMITSA